MAQRATSLVPKPSLLFFCFFFSSVPFFASNRKKLFFPLEKGIICLFLGVSLCFSLAFFGLPLFQLFFLCLSLSLSLVLFFLFFLLVSLFCFLLISCFSLFLSLSFFFAFVHEKNNIKILNCNFLFHQSFLFFWFPVLFFLSNLFFLSLRFSPDFKLCFLFSMNVFGCKQTTLKTQMFGQEGGCNKTFFFSTCVLQNVKSYRFFGGALFGANFG